LRRTNQELCIGKVGGDLCGLQLGDQLKAAWVTNEAPLLDPTITMIAIAKLGMAHQPPLVFPKEIHDLLRYRGFVY
jgi:hypothetical protein